MDFLWSDIEKTKGVYDFSAYDSLLAGLTARHIKPLFILDYGNDLYETGPPRSPEARAAFARFAAAAVRHYHGQDDPLGTLERAERRVLAAAGQRSEYGRLALATAQAIKGRSRMPR